MSPSPRVEQAILDAESRRDAALTSDSKLAPARKPFGDARTSNDDSPWRAGPLYRVDEISDLSINHIVTTGKLAGATKIDNRTISDGKSSRGKKCYV